jgi:hypothetical protein
VVFEVHWQRQRHLVLVVCLRDIVLLDLICRVLLGLGCLMRFCFARARRRGVRQDGAKS